MLNFPTSYTLAILAAIGLIAAFVIIKGKKEDEEKEKRERELFEFWELYKPRGLNFRSAQELQPVADALHLIREAAPEKFKEIMQYEMIAAEGLTSNATGLLNGLAHQGKIYLRTDFVTAPSTTMAQVIQLIGHEALHLLKNHDGGSVHNQAEADAYGDELVALVLG